MRGVQRQEKAFVSLDISVLTGDLKGIEGEEINIIRDMYLLQLEISS